jgi:hypothetical protein
VADRKDDEGKQDCLITFLHVRGDANAMAARRAVIRVSYENLPNEPSALGDVFVLIAGLWPRTRDFVEQQRAVENLGAAVYGGRPSGERCTLARMALDKLNSLSLIGLDMNENSEGFILTVTVHDLIVDAAKTLADKEEQGLERFYRQPPGDNRFNLPQRSINFKHLSRSVGSIPLRGLSAAYSLISGQGTKLRANGSDDDEANYACSLLVIRGGETTGFRGMPNLQCLRLRKCSWGVLSSCCQRNQAHERTSHTRVEGVQCSGEPAGVHRAADGAHEPVTEQMLFAAKSATVDWAAEGAHKPVREPLQCAAKFAKVDRAADGAHKPVPE